MSGAVLVVDDESLFAASVAERLARDGYECAVAGTLAEARGALAEPFDLMLLDVRLPDGSGLDLLAEAPGPSVVMITGFGLGIPFARKVCELHDGALAFGAAPGGGARVELSMPAAGAAAAEAA